VTNDTELGLAAYFYSRDIGRIWRVAEALEYGIVGINQDIISPKGPLARSPRSAA
jgi:succinate-semialdehyde dehydrogenase/glutarate-semialdehyde dehydrogenase